MIYLFLIKFIILFNREAYPEMPVQDVQFAYDIRRLVKVNDKRLQVD